MKYCEYCKMEREYNTLNEGDSKTYVCVSCNSVVGRKKKRVSKKKMEKTQAIAEAGFFSATKVEKEVICISCGRPSPEVFRMLATEDGKALCDHCLKFYNKHFLDTIGIIPLDAETYIKIIQLYEAKQIKYDEVKKTIWIGKAEE
jgi:hypothetical protein